MKTNHDMFVLGDFNFDYNNPGLNQVSKIYLEKEKYSQLVTKPTHIGNHTLDHVYVQQTLTNKVDIYHHHPYYSDHDALLIKIIP